jgi:hypothetical protein
MGKQKEVAKKIAMFGFADEEYYLTSEYILQLAIEPMICLWFLKQKKATLGTGISDFKIEDKKFALPLIKPFGSLFLENLNIYGRAN